MKLTIIIPVYNAAPTLRRCLDSIVKQTWDDFEVILVDDGSDDESADICDEYAKTDRRLTVIHQANGGLSRARNAGLDKAQGNYVTFVDSDDFLDIGTYQALFGILDEHMEYDILEYPAIIHYGNKKAERPLTFFCMEFEDMREYWLQTRAYTHCYMWNKLFRRTLFDGLRFPEGYRFEDVFLYPRLLERTQIMATCDVGVYYYCHNEYGITGTADGEALAQLLEGHSRVNRDWMDSDYYESLLNIQLDVSRMTGNDPRLPVLPYRNTTKQKLLHLIGMKGLCRLNKFIPKRMKHI